MSAVSHTETTDIAGLVHQILSEAGRAVRLMNTNEQYEPETIVVLRKGSVPTIRNILRRHKTQAHRLGHKGMILLDTETGRPYIRCWTGKAPYCVPIDLKGTEHHQLDKLLRRIRRRIHECQ